jgi:hypothetical protein
MHQKFTSILSEGLKDGGAKKDMLFAFENCGNSKMTGLIFNYDVFDTSTSSS